MAGTFEFAEVMYTLSDIYVCQFNFATQAYISEVGRIAAPKKVTADYEHDTDKLSASGRNLRGLSVKKGVALTINAGGMDFNCLAIMAGAVNRTSNTTPNRRRQSDVAGGGAGLPYFGMICTGPTDDGGLYTHGFYAVKLDKQPGFDLDGETNKFSMAETGGYAFVLDIDGGIYSDRAKVFETASDFTAPNSAATFLTYFDSIT